MEEETITNKPVEEEGIKDDDRIWTLPQYHDKERFDAMFKLGKKEYPTELDYIIHLATLSTLMDEDNEKKKEKRKDYKNHKQNRLRNIRKQE